MKIGFTTSFPVEIIFAAGHTPVDMNNLFITDSPSESVRAAESDGLPRNICAWIKGIYQNVIDKGIDKVIGVVQGDCSNTHSLMSLLSDRGIDVITFSFPYDKDKQKLRAEIDALAERFKVSVNQVLEVKKELDEIRLMLIELDYLTYSRNIVTGKENHFWLVSSSDFFGEPDRFKRELEEFVKEVKEREPFIREYRFAYIGVPPIFTDFYDFFEANNVHIVFNEVQRQFSMPYLKEDIVDQYIAFTYPYSVFDRIEDIRTELSRRKVDGIISYAQAFCHRQIDNILLKKYLSLPFLTVEGDFPDALDERTKLRLESFIEMIRFS